MKDNETKILGTITSAESFKEKGMSEKNLTVRVITHWNNLPRQIVESTDGGFQDVTGQGVVNLS